LVSLLRISSAKQIHFHSNNPMYYSASGVSNEDLVNQLVEYDVLNDKRVEEAMKKTDRGFYSADKDYAYVDTPHSIGHGQTISAPHMHATALQVLKDHLKPGASVLDVGSGSGYLCACFARLVGPEGVVVGIDVVKPLVDWSIQNMNKDDPNLLKSGLVILKHSDGWKGFPDKAPYDAIHVGAAAESIPDALMDQLKVGGRMFIPVGPQNGNQYVIQIDKTSQGIKKTNLMGVRYVPLVKKS
jgi:protein-L-isoaspartate(D-aspartate) O-methyltransferase